jgi:RloB-like protein
MAPPRPLARRHRVRRDDRRFVIATEDTYAPEQYFSAFKLERMSLYVVPTRDGRSSAGAVVHRLKEVHDLARRNGELLEDDQFWVVLDTDRWTQGEHVVGFRRAIKEAEDAGFRVAVTNPCFELWLLLHVADPPATIESVEQLVTALRDACGSYSKSRVPIDALMPGVEAAIVRAETLDTGKSGWPQKPGTQVHLLVRELLPFRSVD